jgi:hypothetical protein
MTQLPAVGGLSGVACGDTILIAMQAAGGGMPQNRPDWWWHQPKPDQAVEPVKLIPDDAGISVPNDDVTPLPDDAVSLVPPDDRVLEAAEPGTRGHSPKHLRASESATTNR